jgi:hypothetical protein
MFDEIGCIADGCIYVDNCYFLLCISPFISIECPYLSPLINVSLISSLSEKNIATHASLQGPLSC